MTAFEHIENIGVDISEATLNDAKGITLVQKCAWLDTYPNEKFSVTVEDILAKNMGSEAHVLKWQQTIEKPDTKTFVARKGSEVIGFCFVKKESAQGHLGALYILPAYHHKGLVKD